MPGFPAPFIKFREDDSNGFPLAGGKLFSYVAGTSTPLATYLNQDLAVGHENTNPTILDASGRANVWVQDGIAYKFVLKDALDNTLWTQDNVQVPTAGVSSGGGGPAPPPTTAIPTGSIVPYAGSVAPTDWLLCDGSGVSRTTYNALFLVCGETYGPGNGSTTFNLPNLQQRFPLGKSVAGVGATLGSTGGQIDHVHSGPSHSHTISVHTHTLPAHAHTLAANAFGPSVSGDQTARPNELLLTGVGGGFMAGTNPASTSTQIATDTGVANPPVTAGAGGTQNTGTANPPFLTLNFIIKT